MEHDCQRRGAEQVCNNQMDCPCGCDRCNLAARRQMAERIKAIMHSEPQRPGQPIDWNLNSH